MIPAFALLLTPTVGQPPEASLRERMLFDGRCGSEPPVAAQASCCGRWQPGRRDAAHWWCPDCQKWAALLNGSLVLIWNKKILLPGRDLAARVLSSQVEHRHGRGQKPEFHEFKPSHPLVGVVPHRHGEDIGYAMLFGYCAGCDPWDVGSIGEEWLLPYDRDAKPVGKYIGGDRIGELDPHAPGVFGEREVDVRALAIIGEARGHWKTVVVMAP